MRERASEVASMFPAASLALTSVMAGIPQPRLNLYLDLDAGRRLVLADYARTLSREANYDRILKVIVTRRRWRASEYVPSGPQSKRFETR